ncbi:Ig-like domain-containing protein [Prevotella stercorea]|uniref:Ig-like domain-containing protein n=1 Tax=Leyella stercorea TaxID=363265 RepID=UPI001C2BD2BB|nr:Ig-like domain-containing protein [Leyella stercorea]MBU9897410.1 Ig-like domain-containing protein [Leyella stercorea]
MTIKLKFFNYLFVLVCLIMGTGMSMHAEEQTFTRINSIEELNDGDRFIVVNEELSKAISTWNGVKYFNFTDILIDNGVATTSNIVTILTLEKTTSTKYYYLKTADGFYLSNGSTPSSANVTALKSIPDNTSMATIAIDKTHAEIVFENKVKKAFLFAEGTGFSCYDYTYHDASRRMLAIYKADGSQSAIKQTTFVTFSSKDLTIYKGKEYSLPTASVTRQKGETIADAKLSYSSSNEKVASVNKYTGEITLKEFGTTTITAKYAGSDLYKESEGSYTLTYQDRLSEATIVFSAENEAFYNMPKNSDNHALPQNCIFMSDNGEEYKFKIYCFYKHRVNKGFLTSISGDAKVTSPEFLAPNGYVVRVVFEQKYNGSRPYISSAAQTNYIKNGEGTLTALNEYEFTETIPDSKPFTITSTSICYIKKIEIFINPVPSLEISDTDFEADAKIKEYDKTAVHFKLKRSFVADDTWYTICLPFNVAKEQLVEVFGGKKVELRTFDHMEDGTVMYFKHVDDLAAGVPYLIKPNKTLDSLLFKNVKIDMAAHPDLQVGADGYFMKGTYQATVLNPDGTNLFLGDNNTFFRPSEDDHRMKGTRVYFIIPRKAVGKVLSYDTETIVDGIVDVEVNSLSNSQKVYNINGVYVGDNLQNLTPGVYIVSGKKVVVTNR